ncbi:hypothetical protein [Cryptosporangium sp. NPDC051539]|uniref:hypothetical protein n=1 Tax=Cryptosporangium sp. NPDC051539 TaxID=3363962 RepID=UPI0037B33CA9
MSGPPMPGPASPMSAPPLSPLPRSGPPRPERYAPHPRENVTEPIPGAAGRVTGRGRARAGVPVVTIGDLLTVLGGVLVLAFSLLPFVSYTDGRYEAVKNRADVPTSWTAWASGTFLTPLSWIAIVAAVAVAVLGALRVLGRGRFTVLGLTAAQIRVLLSGLTLLILLGLGVSPKTVMFGDDRPQITAGGVKIASTLSLDLGGYLMLLAGVVLVVGTVLTAGGGGTVLWPPSNGVRPDFLRTPGRAPRGRLPQPSRYPGGPPPPGYGPPPGPPGYGPPPRY